MLKLAEELGALAAKPSLYHGSPLQLETIAPRTEHGDPDVAAAVFATPSRTFALPYAGKKWGDRDLQQSIRTDPDGNSHMELREMRPGALKDLFDRQTGYVYHVPADTFSDEKRRCQIEVLSDQAVKPHKVETVPDVLAALKADSHVKLVEYSPHDPALVSHFTRMARRAKEMTPEKRQEYLRWWGETATPEMLAKLHAAMTAQGIPPDLAKVAGYLAGCSTGTL